VLEFAGTLPTTRRAIATQRVRPHSIIILCSNINATLLRSHNNKNNIKSAYNSPASTVAIFHNKIISTITVSYSAQFHLINSIHQQLPTPQLLHSSISENFHKFQASCVRHQIILKKPIKKMTRYEMTVYIIMHRCDQQFKSISINDNDTPITSYNSTSLFNPFRHSTSNF